MPYKRNRQITYRHLAGNQVFFWKAVITETLSGAFAVHPGALSILHPFNVSLTVRGMNFF